MWYHKLEFFSIFYFHYLSAKLISYFSISIQLIKVQLDFFPSHNEKMRELKHILKVQQENDQHENSTLSHTPKALISEVYNYSL
jgi:hypothetical protein